MTSTMEVIASNMGHYKHTCCTEQSKGDKQSHKLHIIGWGALVAAHIIVGSRLSGLQTYSISDKLS